MLIDKLAWLRIEKGRVLCARSHGKHLYYLPGGKREPGESDEAALRREVQEELTVSLVDGTLRPAGCFEAQADGKADGVVVRLTCYEADYDGTLQPAAEIAELAWLGVDDLARCSAAARVVIEALARERRLG